MCDRNYHLILFQIILVFYLLVLPHPSEAFEATESEIKAAYLFKFTRFVVWPESRLGPPDSTFKVCVLGKNPFAKVLEKLTALKVEGHPIAINYPNSIDTAKNCHLLYIAYSDPDRVAQILNSITDLPILTVSSAPNFVQLGGAIGFMQVGQNLRFAISNSACRRHGLECSAKLLEAAVYVFDYRRENTL